ncbi:hypothetical protein [Flaviaesturariibacter amylovorans]|uniref:DUF3945 domain-containing protein n=1 Tax=Flaviaesturariibacter amylovorans TaxID=1084520 RepID=A0ABP8HI02_9BACT
MNEKNYEFLANQIKYTGFGEGLAEVLKEKLAQGAPEFTLRHEAAFGTDKTEATLHFRRSNESDMYFFNRYNLALKNDKLQEPLQQSFYINGKQDNITLKEGYNLLSGRAVHKDLTTKEGESYRAWVQLDFKQSEANGNFKTKQFREAYGFDLEQALNKHNIKELQTPEDRDSLVRSLERGNRQAVTLEAEGGPKQIFIEAAPQFKSLNLYEPNGRRIINGKEIGQDSTKEGVRLEQGKGQSKGQKLKAGSDGEGSTQKKASRKSRNSIS